MGIPMRPARRPPSSTLLLLPLLALLLLRYDDAHFGNCGWSSGCSTRSIVQGGKRVSCSAENCDRSEMFAPWWKPESVSWSGWISHSTF